MPGRSLKTLEKKFGFHRFKPGEVPEGKKMPLCTVCDMTIKSKIHNTNGASKPVRQTKDSISVPCCKCRGKGEIKVSLSALERFLEQFDGEA